MASSVCWNFTELPLDIIDILDRDIQKFDASVQPSRLKGDIQNSFVPSQFSILLLLILGIPTIYFGVQWTYIHEWVDSALKFFIPNFLW